MALVEENKPDRVTAAFTFNSNTVKHLHFNILLMYIDFSRTLLYYLLYSSTSQKNNARSLSKIIRQNYDRAWFYYHLFQISNLYNVGVIF